MASIPGELRGALDEALRERAAGGVDRVEPVGGGCINNGARLLTDGGETLFLKWNARIGPEVFEAEVDGLLALRGPGALRVPTPIAWGGGNGVPAWLLMEHVAPGRPAPNYGEAMGRGLAELHAGGHSAAPPGGPFGWPIDNWIGSLPQSNAPGTSWADFWRDERIMPQLDGARARGHLAGRSGHVLDELVGAIPGALRDVEVRPSLLHGDLWGGNAYAGPNGEPVLIDPAVYVGHDEVDLAMTDLFGGFGRAFYRAYDEVAGISAAYDAYLRDLYQLYYLLVHVNLFGSSYEGGAVAAARRVVAAVG